MNELDNRVAAQTTDAELAGRFAKVAEAMAANEEAIVAELNEVQGPAVDVGGYYKPDTTKTDAAMRPCSALNDIVANV